jgi:hypothetical protein
MKKVSTKQAALNREVAKIKRKLEKRCVICGTPAYDGAHLLNKGNYPEHYTQPLNIVILCRNCHDSYDNNLSFRQQQVKLYNQICLFDSIGAAKYFRIYE